MEQYDTRNLLCQSLRDMVIEYSSTKGTTITGSPYLPKNDVQLLGIFANYPTFSSSSESDLQWWTMSPLAITISDVGDTYGKTLLPTIMGFIYRRYADYMPIYTFERTMYEINRTLSYGSKEINDVYVRLSISLLQKYGILSTSTSPAWEDVQPLLERAMRGSNSTTGSSNVDGTTTSTDSAKSDGSGKAWSRSRPINYKTTDENTADAVNGSSSTSTNSSTSDGKSTNKRTYNDSGTSETSTTDANLLMVLEELQRQSKSLIQRMVDSVGFLFVNAFSA